jgi:two-component system phosphate regulon response regulator PhoB
MERLQSRHFSGGGARNVNVQPMAYNPMTSGSTGVRRSVLIVEDERDLADLLQMNLEREGYACHRTTSGDAALDEIRQHRPDLIVLDRMLPGLSGDELLAQIRRNRETRGIPVIMLTAKSEEADVLVGFAIGADDYMTKPFSMKVLIARIAAMFRRSDDERGVEELVLSGGPIHMAPDRFEVTVEGMHVSLTATEFRILRALLSMQGRVLDRGRLIDLSLGTAVAVTDRTIDVHIASLRKKLGSAAAWIQTVRGVGYTFRPPSDTSSDE